MPTKLIEGVYAALLTPRSNGGGLDEPTLGRLLDFLLRHEINGVVLNGATGELCLTTPDELERLAQLTARHIVPEHQLICGIGSPSVQLSCRLAEIAARNGATAVLLPPPYFFPYQQEDVAAFCSAVADRSPLPVLLYNLPSFTSPIEMQTAVRLLQEHPNILGIKDSSGSVKTLEALTAGKAGACRIVGSDAALIQARENELCDAVVSGVACALPELIVSIFNHSPTYGDDCLKLNQFLHCVGQFPTPWGLKFIAEARGLAPAYFAQTLSPARLEQGRQLQHWFKHWYGSN